MSLRLIGFVLAASVAAASWALTCVAWRFDQVREGVIPLDPRAFEALTVVTLGTGGAYENPSRLGPALAVGLGERIALVDSGRGVAEALRAAGVPVRQVGPLLLTSLAPENTVGLDDLLATGWIDGREAPLGVIGPPGTRALVEHLLAAHGPALRAIGESLDLPAAGVEVEVQEVGDGWSGSLGELSVRAAELPGGPVAARGYRFEARGRSVVIAPVGWAPDAVVELARGADLLVHEAAFIPTPEIAEEIGLDVSPERLLGEAALHTAIDDVGGLASRAGVASLVLVRLRPPPVYDFQITGEVGESYGGRIAVADDGDEFTP